MAISINTDHALQMISAGWTVKHSIAFDDVEWRSPDGISGWDYHSTSIDNPPEAAFREAIEQGHIKPVLRVPA